MTIRTLALPFAAIAVGCEVARLRAPSPPLPALTVHTITLPGTSSRGVSLDYLAYDRAHRRVWVPAGETGTVAVVDVDDHVAIVHGFATAEMERHGTKRIVGPSAAAVGDGVVYVGNRADSSVCAVDAESLRRGPCTTLESMPDGLAYVSPTKEVWATTPRDNSITILDAAGANALTWKGRLALDGAPEGFAVDETRGVFFTNLEDRDRTLTIDIRSRQVTSTWVPGCGAAGPRGLALDRGLNMLVVACPDHVVVLDAGHDGKRLSTMNVGDGLDSIDVVESRHELYAAAARAATLTIAHLDSQGGVTLVATAATRVGARNAVVTEEGVAYLTDGAEGKILVVAPTAPTPR
jgi:DNA-binding beta-propeller fold protein YncE